MKYLLAAVTYFGYIFVITLYTLKIKKYLGMPVHLRSEVYPEIPGAQGSRKKSQYENVDWWTKPHGKNRLRRFWFLFNDYFLLTEYFRRDRGYWYFLYPWHIGFITIISFHILSFFGAVALLLGIPVVSDSPSLIGNALYSFSLIMGVMSFSAGLFGSVGILITRLTRSDLRDYATPQNYFTYIFLLAVFLSGLYAWLVVDPNFLEYREFWKGLITFETHRCEIRIGGSYLPFCPSFDLSSFHPLAPLHHTTFWIPTHTVG